MFHFLYHLDRYDIPILLSEDEKKYPYKVLTGFFEDYRLSELREIIWEMTETGLTTDNVSFNEPEQRATLLTRSKDFVKLFEAVQVIVMERLEKNNSQ